MSKYFLRPEDVYKSKQKRTLADYCLEETKSMDSNLDTDESMLSYLSSANDIYSVESLNHIYEAVHPSSRSIKENVHVVSDTSVNSDNSATIFIVDKIDLQSENLPRVPNASYCLKKRKESKSENTSGIQEKNINQVERDKVYSCENCKQPNDEQMFSLEDNQTQYNKKSKSKTKINENKNKIHDEMKTEEGNIGKLNGFDMEKNDNMKDMNVKDTGRTTQGNILKENANENKQVCFAQEQNEKKPTETMHVRVDHSVNKVSPFDSVPGFTQNSVKKSTLNTHVTMSPNNTLRLDEIDVINSSQDNTMLSSRNMWTIFDDALQSKPAFCSLPSESKKMDCETCIDGSSWVAFDDIKNISEPKNNAEVVKKSNSTSEISKELIKSQEESLGSKNSLKLSSTENLLNVVNRTVSLIRNITKPENGDEDKSLLKNNKLGNDSASEISSDDVISLDYESEDGRKTIWDTAVKQYPDVTLFCALSTRDSAQVAAKSLLSSKQNDTISIDHLTPLDNYPGDINRKTWSFWFRYPDRKKRIGKRNWSPVTLSVEEDYIRLRGEATRGSEIIKEIPLQPYLVFTVPVLHCGDKDGKMRSVKLQYVKYRETHKIKSRFKLEHTPVYTPVLKVASRDVTSLKEFTEKVENIIRCLPTRRDKGITYRHEEIFIDCDDDCRCLLTGDGKISKYNITTLLRLRVFVSGNPEFKLFLNDVNNKDVLTRTKENLLRDTRRTRVWISPEKCEYHPCVDQQKTEKDGGVIFTPPDGCSFELMRYRVRRKAMLPLLATSSLELLTGNSVRLQATVQVVGDMKSLRHKRHDVVMHFPIPSTWSMLFVRSRSLTGNKKYIKTNCNTKMSGPVAATLSRVTLQVSCGKAKYEPALGAIVWELGNLPLMVDGIPADVQHMFQCYFELPFPLEIRDEFQPFAYLDYHILHQFASGTTVEEVLLSDGRVPDKWVCYRANYSYKLSMTLIENGRVRNNPEKFPNKDE